jgi:hypothetical protein
MQKASLIFGSLALGGGIVKFMDISEGATADSSLAALVLCLLGLLFLGAGYIGRQNQKAQH